MNTTTETHDLDAIPVSLRRTTPVATTPVVVTPKATKPVKAARPTKTAKTTETTETKPKATKKAAKTGVDASKAAGDGATDQVRIRRSIVPAKFKQAYSQHQDTCGDKIGLTLKAATTKKNEDGRDTLDLAALKAIASANGLTEALDGYITKGLNNGQLRMNIGNKLRGMLKNEEKVVIGKQTFANAEKALAKPQAAA